MAAQLVPPGSRPANASARSGASIVPLAGQATRRPTFAAALRDVDRPPALILVRAILSTLDAETYDAVARAIAPAAAGGEPAAVQADAVLRTCRLTHDELVDALAAAKREARA